MNPGVNFWDEFGAEEVRDGLKEGQKITLPQS
jgi:hypothetical protein